MAGAAAAGGATMANGGEEVAAVTEQDADGAEEVGYAVGDGAAGLILGQIGIGRVKGRSSIINIER